jgi:hypothetical protein
MFISKYNGQIYMICQDDHMLHSGAMAAAASAQQLTCRIIAS